MEIRCAGCGCMVDRGTVTRRCDQDHCCCDHLEAEGTQPDRTE